ncbi:hypothetical protein GCM10027447_32700 [Glycomyces halotolerans]
MPLAAKGSGHIYDNERQPALRSPYTLDNPPPDEPPNGVLVPSLWRVQARWWKRHTPAADQRTARRPVCGHCRQAWPCHSWACWDGQLGEAVAAPVFASESVTGTADSRPEVVTRMPERTPVSARAPQQVTASSEERSAA